jgi:hypothetical protein
MADERDREERDEPKAVDDDEIVIAPGGPRRRSSVRRVGPDETVRRNPDGTYTVVPRQPPD